MLTNAKGTFLFSILLSYIFTSPLYAEDVSFTLEDRDRLKRLEVVLQEFKESTDKRLTELREDMNKRFEDVNKRFEQMISFLWMITGIFTTLTLGVIGFAFWDRRTVIRAAKAETIETIEKEGRLQDLISVLREISKTNPQVESALRKFHLL